MKANHGRNYWADFMQWRRMSVLLQSGLSLCVSVCMCLSLDLISGLSGSKPNSCISTCSTIFTHNPNQLGPRSVDTFIQGWEARCSGHTGLGRDSIHSDPLPVPLSVRDPRTRDLPWTHGSAPTQIQTPAHSHCPPIQPGHRRAAQDTAGEHLSCPRCWQHSSERLSCWRACSPFSCPETEHKGALTCLPLAPRSVQGVPVRTGPVIGTGSLGPISPQRSHYHVIWGGGDSVCMESLGRLQGGADLTPRAPHPHPRLGTSDDSWKLLGRSTRAAEQRAGEFSVFPVGEPKFTMKVKTGRDTHSAAGLPSLFPVGHFPSSSHFSRLFQSVFSLTISMWSGGWAYPSVWVPLPFLIIASGLFYLETQLWMQYLPP